MARGVWRLSDPKISLASAASMFLGACVAAARGPLDVPWLALTVLGIFLIEVGKNASGEIFDWKTDSAVRDEDRSPFSGGKRVLVDGLLTRGQARAVASVGFAGGIAIGLWIAAVREPRVLLIGLIGGGAAYFYNAPPLRLAYHGLGELAVATCYGPLIMAGTLLVQRHEISGSELFLSVPLGLLIAAFLWICEFPDLRADRATGKRNLVVRLGPRRASFVFVAWFAAAAIATVLAPALGAPRGVWLGLLFLVPATPAAVLLIQFPERTRRIIPAQALTLGAFLVYSAAVGVGLVFWR